MWNTSINEALAIIPPPSKKSLIPRIKCSQSTIRKRPQASSANKPLPAQSPLSHTIQEAVCNITSPSREMGLRAHYLRSLRENEVFVYRSRMTVARVSCTLDGVAHGAISPLRRSGCHYRGVVSVVDDDWVCDRARRVCDGLVWREFRGDGGWSRKG